MANPQRENGHVDIANEIMDHLIKIRIPGEERQIFDVIMRQTWGYCELKNGKPYKDENGNLVKKKFDAISYSQFEQFTGIKRRKIWELINKLLDKNLIIKKYDGRICKYGIQKDWEKWKISPKKMTVTKNGDITKNGDRVSPKMVTELSPIMVHTKEKERKYTKENTSSTPIFNYKTREWENITEKDIEDWSRLNPNCNVRSELEHMRQYLISLQENDKRRIKKYFRKFIAGWIKRSSKYKIKSKEIEMEEALKELSKLGGDNYG